MSDEIKFTDLDLSELLQIFPEAKLTLRDRIPANTVYFYTILNLLKTIKDIKFSEAEIRESILALVAMIPDEIRDKKFQEELEAATQIMEIDVRPIFCEVPASEEYCQRKGIKITQQYQQANYFEMLQAVCNLLQRNNMWLQKQSREIMMGTIASGEEKNVTQEKVNKDE